MLMLNEISPAAITGREGFFYLTTTEFVFSLRLRKLIIMTMNY